MYQRRIIHEVLKSIHVYHNNCLQTHSVQAPFLRTHASPKPPSPDSTPIPTQPCLRHQPQQTTSRLECNLLVTDVSMMVVLRRAHAVNPESLHPHRCSTCIARSTRLSHTSEIATRTAGHWLVFLFNARAICGIQFFELHLHLVGEPERCRIVHFALLQYREAVNWFRSACAPLTECTDRDLACLSAQGLVEIDTSRLPHHLCAHGAERGAVSVIVRAWKGPGLALGSF
jgi:hypothetical protein